MTPARAIERARVPVGDAGRTDDRRRRRATSVRGRDARDGRGASRARAIADGEDADDSNAADDAVVDAAIEATRAVTSTVTTTVRRTRAIAGMLEGKDEKVAEAELKALTSRAANETSSLLEDLAPYARPSEDAAWEEYERAREDAMRRGVAFSAVMGMGVAAVTSTVGVDALLASVESIPPLAAFEQLLGFAVTLYYGAVYRRLLTTSEGRRGLRLSFAEAFSQISGAAELVGRAAATNAALDGAVRKTMENIRAMPSNEVPPSVTRAMDVYVRSRDAEKSRLQSAVVEREREAVRLRQEREAKAKAMERKRANQKREREQAMERRKRDIEAKTAAVKRERETKAREAKAKAAAAQREREAKAEAAQREREAKAEAAQREREAKAEAAAEAQAARQAQAKAAQDERDAQAAKAAQDERDAQAAKAAQDERNAQAAKAAQDERDAQAAKAAQDERDAQAAKAAQDERDAQAAKAKMDREAQIQAAKAEFERQARERTAQARAAQEAKESRARQVTSVVTKTDETVAESVNEEIESLRAKLAAETEKFEHVSKDLEKLMEDDITAKSALKEARAELETLRAQLAEAESAPRADPEEVESLRAKLAAETEKFEHVSKDLEKLMEDDITAKSALKEARAELETLRAQLAEAESAPRADPEEVESLRKQLADMEARMNEEVERLRVALASSRDETERTRADLNMWEQRAKEASSRVDELTARVSKLIDPSQLEAVTAERDGLQGKLRDALSEAHTEAANARALSDEVQEVRAELSIEVSKTVSLKKDLDGLRESVAAMKESLEKTNIDMERYRLEKESALEAVRNAEAQAEQKTREMREELSRALAEKDKTIAEVETEKDTALSEMAKLQEVINGLTLKRNELAQKDARIQLLESRVESTRKERDEIRNGSRATEQALQAAKNAANELKRTYDSEIASLKSKMVDGAALRAVEVAAEKDAKRQQQEIERLIDAEAAARRALDEAEALTRRTTEEYENEKKRLEAELVAKQDEIEQARREAQAEISDMRVKYDALTVQKSKIEESIEEMKQTMEAESIKSQELVENTKRLASETSYRMQNEIDRLREETVLSRSKLAAETEKFEHVSKDLEKLMQDDITAKSALKEARAELETLRAQLAEAESAPRADPEEVESLRAKLAAETEKFEHVSKDLEKLMEDDITAKSALKEARAELETLRAQLAEAEALTRRTTEEYENEKKRLEAELVAKQDEIEQARREAQAEISDMRVKYDALTVQKSKIEESIEEMKQTMEAESIKSQELVENTKRLASETSYRMQNEIDRLREETVLSRSKLAAETEKFEHVSKDLEKLMQDDITAKSALKEARAELETLRAQLAEAESAPRADPEEVESLRAKLAAETEKFEHVSKDLEKLMEDDITAKSALKEARAELETLRAQLAEAESAPRADPEEVESLRAKLADMEARMNEEMERSRAAAEEMERRLAAADKRASELQDTLRNERESAAKTLEEIKRERDLQLAKDDIDLERQQIREEAAAEIQSLTERAAQELAEAESRFAAQLEEVEARLAAAEIAARDAEANAESIAKVAAAAQTEAASSTSPTPVTVADATLTERPAIVFDPTALVALSKMKREELVAEAEARGLDSTGVTAELRNRLRDARAIEKRAATQKSRAQSRKKPTGYYRVIATVKYDNKLLSTADDIMAEFGEINRVGVEKLFAELFDGAGATEVELRTMDILLAGGGGRYEYILTDPAIAYLQPRLDAVREINAQNAGLTKSKSQYAVEDGVKYDDGLLSFARSIAASRRSIDVIHAEIIFNSSLDGGVITDTEITTLERVLSSADEFPLDADARAWFERALARVASER